MRIKPFTLLVKFYNVQSARVQRVIQNLKPSSLRSPAVHPISHQPGWLASCNTRLKIISAHQSSLANWASPAHVIRPLVLPVTRPKLPFGQIGHIRYVNILTWLQGRVKLLYLVLFSLYPSLFWELRDKGSLKNLQF